MNVESCKKIIFNGIYLIIILFSSFLKYFNFPATCISKFVICNLEVNKIRLSNCAFKASTTEPPC